MPELFLRQELKLQQKLVMTQQLQLAIKLLQMSRMDLDQEIQEQLTENPCLEEDLAAPRDTGPAIQNQNSLDAKKPSLDEIERVATAPKEQEAKETEASEKSEVDWDRFVDNYESFRDGGPTIRRDADDQPSFEAFVAAQTTLQDHLKWQLRLTETSEDIFEIAEEIIGNINDHGYLKAKNCEADLPNDDENPLVALAEQMKASQLRAEEALSIIQGFEPVGVGARNLRECLLIQCRHFHPDNEELTTLVSNHLKDLERRKGKQICRAMKIDSEKLSELAQVLASLEPQPGRPFSGQHNPYIVPDVHVHKVDDEYLVQLNEDGLTRLKVSKYYRSGLRGQDTDARAFIKQRLDAAHWFIKSIEQRQQTIRKVSESIVAFQRPFLEKGSEFLVPLVLRDVADQIGMHESTVSRVTSNKYMHTPQGIFPMKYFFNSRIEREGSPDIASEAVKRKIKRYIEQEEGRKPLSDQAIADRLGNDEGIKIARRTVAKYREQLRIPSSSERKTLS